MLRLNSAIKLHAACVPRAAKQLSRKYACAAPKRIRLDNIGVLGSGDFGVSRRDYSSYQSFRRVFSDNKQLEEENKQLEEVALEEADSEMSEEEQGSHNISCMQLQRTGCAVDSSA